MKKKWFKHNTYDKIRDIVLGKTKNKLLRKIIIL